MAPLQKDSASCILLGKRLKFKFLYLLKQAFCGLFFLVSVGTFAARERLVRGFAKDAATDKPIPFPIISSEDGVYQAMGDMEGHFVIQLPFSVENITVRAYSYLPTTIAPDLADSARAYLNFAHPFSFQTITYGPSKQLMKQLKKARYAIDPRMEKGFSYLSYNKVIITTESILSLKLQLDGLLRFFGSRPAHLSLDHHIFLMESASKRVFQDRFNQRETIVDSKVSGINKPPALNLVSGFEAMSVYEPFLRIGTRKYISPLGGNFNKRYIFSITDSVKIDSQYVYIVKFNPRSLRNRDLLQGFLFVSKNPLGVMGFYMWPAFDRESTYSLLQECSLLPSGRWFPAQLKTVYNRSSLGTLKIPIQATSKTYIFNIAPLNSSDSSHFSEVIFDFKKESPGPKKEFPIELRQEALSQKDRNTYTYFKDVGSLDAIDQYLNLGQKLIAGRFPMGKIDLVFRKAVTVNEVEGLRLGLGLQTTEKLSQRHLGGGYFAYGIRDKKWKFGVNYQYNFSDRHSLLVQYQNDLAEPGIQSFAFNKLQYATEPLRNFRIPRFDRIRLFELSHVAHPYRNISTKLGLAAGDREYLYDYHFLPDAEHNSFQIVELKGAVRWSPGEQFARYEYERFSLGNPFPEFWLQGSQGIKGVVENSYNYTRLEAKMQWTRKILGLGEFGIQVGAGRQWGLVPYPLLFTARASFRDVSLVTFNSFETMRYNEFINDRYANVFISHKFSKMQISNLPFRPFFILMHNMGWGQITHPEVHQGIEVKAMPKGYYESGLFLNDLFVLPFFGLRTGVGAGAFVRYGAYALPSDFDNLVIKFAVNLGI